MSATLSNDAAKPAQNAAEAAKAEKKLATFRAVSLAEGVSFLLLLCVGMPLKYGAGLDVAVKITGMLHGLLFLAYVALAWDQKVAQRWDLKRFAVVLVASVLPTGPFWLHKSLKSAS